MYSGVAFLDGFSFLQVSVGTLLAFTMVAISVLILRYVPPDVVPLPPSFQDAIDSVAVQYGCSSNNGIIEVENPKVHISSCESTSLLVCKQGAAEHPLLEKSDAKCCCKFSAFLSEM